MIYASINTENRGPVIRPKKGFSIHDCKTWISQVRKNVAAKNQEQHEPIQLKLNFG